MILILGRFQPFHNGHLKVVKQACGKDDKVIIAIGSSQKRNEKRNPFSVSERRQMINATLKASSLKARLISVPDIPCDNTYVKHVEKHMTSRPDLIITENKRTHILFKKAGYNVRLTPRYYRISSTKIRRLIAENKQWKTMVPIQVVQVINKIKGTSRIRKIFSEYAC